MITRLYDLIFGCTHSNMSRVFTLRDPRNRRRSYQCCMDCGKEFPFNWHEMRRTA